jgi:hypothetical protein
MDPYRSRAPEPAWLAALTPAGELTFRDISALLGDHPHELLFTLRRRTGYFVDTVRVRTRAGSLLLYFADAGRGGTRQPVNQHARKLVLHGFGTCLGTYRGTFLIVGEHDDHEAGLTVAQQQLLCEIIPSAPGTRPGPDREHGANLALTARST